MRVTTQACPYCQSRITVTVSRRGYERYRRGHCNIQSIVPDQGRAERFLSGICPACWDERIGDE